MAIRESDPTIGKPAGFDRSLWMRRAIDGPATDAQLACLLRMAARQRFTPPVGWGTITRKQASLLIRDGLDAWPTV